MAVFVVTPYLTSEKEKKLWLNLSQVCVTVFIILLVFMRIMQVFRLAYCVPFDLSNAEYCKKVCKDFVLSVKECCPQNLKKMKIHLLLHLVDDMCHFGPTSAFNTERYMNSLLYTCTRTILIVCITFI